MIYLNLAGIAIAVAAFVLSLKAFLLSRKLPNENKIFEEKIRVYHVLIKATNETSSVILSCIDDYDWLKKERDQELDEEAEEMNEDIDDAFKSLEDAIAENSLVYSG